MPGSTRARAARRPPERPTLAWRRFTPSRLTAIHLIMRQSGNTGIKRIIRAGGYSWQGFVAAFRNEAAFRQELGLTLVLIPLAYWLGDTPVERAVMIGIWLLVPTIELINSGIEAVVDRIGEEHHPLAGRAKDVGSAAVFLAFSNAAIVWAIILFT